MADRLQRPDDQAVFSWEGIDQRRARVRGELLAASPQQARAELRRQGIHPLRVRKKPKPLFNLASPIKPKDIMLFTRQLSTMLNAGLPVAQALDMVGNSSRKPALSTLATAIRQEVEGGSGLAQALARHPRYFDDLYCGLVRAGEEAGALEAMFGKLALHLEKTQALKAKVNKALLYPTAVLSFAVAVTVVLLIFVIPAFQGLFQSFGADLPGLTRWVIDLSRLCQERWPLLFGLPLLALAGFVKARKKSPGFSHWVDAWTLKLPVLGALAMTSANARFARTLATLFNGGVPLMDAIASVARVTGNQVYERAVLEMRDAVAMGQQLNFVMGHSRLFPPLVVQMVAIGEESGALGDMLTRVADLYEEDLDNQMNMLTTLIEPALMAILAVIIGGLIVAMYLPIFQLAMVV